MAELPGMEMATSYKTEMPVAFGGASDRAQQFASSICTKLGAICAANAQSVEVSVSSGRVR